MAHFEALCNTLYGPDQSNMAPGAAHSQRQLADKELKKITEDV